MMDEGKTKEQLLSQLAEAQAEIERLSAQYKQLAEQRDSVFALSPCMLCNLDEDGIFYNVNPAFAKNTGFDAADLLFRPLFNFIHPEDQDSAANTIRAVAHNKTGAFFTNRFLCKDGSYKWLLWSVISPPREKTLYCIVQDFTPYKQMEESLRKSEEQYRTLVEQAFDGIFITDCNGNYLDVNPAGCTLLGYSREEILQMNARELASAEFIPLFDAIVSKVFSGETVVSEWGCERKDGTSIPTEISMKQLSDGRLQVFVRDISQRKQAEKVLQAKKQFLSDIFASIQDGISILDAELTIIRVNPAMEKLYAESVPLAGKKCYKAYHSLEQPCDNCPALQTLKTGKPFSVLAPVKDLQGNVTGWTEDFCSPLVDATTGKMKGVILYSRDVTEKINFQQELAHLDRLNVVGELAASIGHEIRNPMTTVRGFLQILKTKEECKPYTDYFSLMIGELDRANSIITEFLSLAKNRTSDLKPQNLNEIIKTIYPLILASAVNSEIRVKLELGDIPNLLLDENEIRQLLLNLTRNGIEAMADGGTLTIKTYKIDKEIVLAVQDQGSGIKPELLEKIGTPFFTTKEQGTGLGLAMCYSIAERHNASIKVQTNPQGTTFFVRFKL